MKTEVGIDIGGTFTDIVWRQDDGTIGIKKLASTPKRPSKAAITAVHELSNLTPIDQLEVRRIVHGTTVATNAVLERKGAKIGLITTQGFRDVLEIGRQWRQSLYQTVLEPETPTFIAPRARRLEVAERTAADGRVVTPLDEAALLRAVDQLVADGVEAIAVCFLFSFLNPTSELRARDIIESQHPGLMTSLSCEVDPAFREYERTAITVFDSYVKPVVDRYLDELENAFTDMGDGIPLQIMHSRGGVTGPQIARSRPVRLFLSGPAAGVIGARAAALTAGESEIISLDIGGTSADIALVSGGKPLLRAEGVIGGFPVRVPMVDINTIGAGGGSIAWLDAAGGLRVGPESAGSEPGPACYGLGGKRATVTDASLVLGYLDADYFAAGTLTLDAAAAHTAISETIAQPLGMTIEEAARGVHRVVNTQMAEGIRLVSVRQGYAPRNFTLVPFGGAGPVHAIALARELDLREIIVPRHPGVLSAAGLLGAPIEHEVSAAFPHPLSGLEHATVKCFCAQLDQRCGALMKQDGITNNEQIIEHFADICYDGQSFYLETPLDLNAPDPLTRVYESFRKEHERVHGHSTDNPARIVNLRTIHRGPALEIPHAPDAVPASPRPQRSRVVSFLDHSQAIETPVLHRTALEASGGIRGPAIIEQEDTTIVLEPGWSGSVEASGMLRLSRE